MGTTRQLVEFTRAAVDEVVAVMDELTSAGDGKGWINIGPALTDEEAASVPVRSGLSAWFSGRGPAVPMATWTPAATTARPRPAQVGVEHGTGPDALERLREAGSALPGTWTKRQDHAKHGIVADLPGEVSAGDVVRWMVDAVSVLSNGLVRRDAWMAVVHRPG